jgi:hypothetical protein
MRNKANDALQAVNLTQREKKIPEMDKMALSPF